MQPSYKARAPHQTSKYISQALSKHLSIAPSIDQTGSTFLFCSNEPCTSTISPSRRKENGGMRLDPRRVRTLDRSMVTNSYSFFFFLSQNTELFEVLTHSHLDKHSRTFQVTFRLEFYRTVSLVNANLPNN